MNVTFRGSQRNRLLNRHRASTNPAPSAPRAGIVKHVGPHTVSHSLATHLLETGYDIRTIRELSSHKDVRTRVIYAPRPLNKGGRRVRSPLDG